MNTRELAFHVFAPNEPTVDIEPIVMQARGEGHQRLFQGFNRQGAKEMVVVRVAQWEENQSMLIIMEQKYQAALSGD